MYSTSVKMLMYSQQNVNHALHDYMQQRDFATNLCYYVGMAIWTAYEKRTCKHKFGRCFPNWFLIQSVYLIGYVYLAFTYCRTFRACEHAVCIVHPCPSKSLLVPRNLQASLVGTFPDKANNLHEPLLHTYLDLVNGLV